MPYTITPFGNEYQGRRQGLMTSERLTATTSVFINSSGLGVGSWFVVTSNAPRNFGFHLHCDFSATGGAGYVDVAIGGVGSEQVICSKMPIHWIAAANASPGHAVQWIIPIPVPKGETVSMRGKANANASHSRWRINFMTGYSGPTFQFCSGRMADRATPLTGTNPTITGSSGALNWKGFMPFIGPDGGAQIGANIQFGFAVRSSANESVWQIGGRIQADHDQGPQFHQCNFPWPMAIPANTTLYMETNAGGRNEGCWILFR
jgi:hypothetical protein